MPPAVFKTLFPTENLGGVFFLPRQQTSTERLRLWPERDFDAIDCLPIVDSLGVIREVPLSTDSGVYLPYEWPSIQCSRHKLVWMISSDCNWDGLNNTKLLTLDLSTMRFTLQEGDEPGFVCDSAERAGFCSSSLGNANDNALMLSESGQRLAFCLSDCDDPQHGYATVLLRWQGMGWDVEAVVQETLPELIEANKFSGERAELKATDIELTAYQPARCDAPIPASEMPESLKWKLRYFDLLSKHKVL